jgi:acyl-CoA thioester hydrolase
MAESNPEGRTGPFMNELLAGFAVTIEAPVAWGEMDAFAHVNNAVYFRWFESARIAWLFRIGFGGGDSSIGPILASTHCRFRLPLTYPDTVRVGARATEVRDDRFTMEYRIISQTQQAIAAEGGGVVVAYDYERGTKTRLPEAVRQAIAALDDFG